MTTQKKTKYVHEGKYVAEVEVDLIIGDDEWSPHLSVKDAYKLDDVRAALSRGDINVAAKNARVFEMLPVAV